MEKIHNYHFGAIISAPDPRDWQYEALLSSSASDDFTPISKLPATLDLRVDMEPVRSQGTIGSCLAFTLAAVKEWHERKDCEFKGYMSPAFIYKNRPNFPSSGMTTNEAYAILNNIGSCAEDLMPYEQAAENDERPITKEMVEYAQNFRTKSYYRVNTIDACKQALFDHGP